MNPARNPLVTLLCAVLLAASAAAHAQPQVIKLASLVPDGSVWHKILQGTGAEWSTATGGRVTLRIYPGGVAGDEPDMVRKLRPLVAVLCFAVALFLGFAAGFVPAWGAYRSKITEMLRTV